MLNICTSVILNKKHTDKYKRIMLFIDNLGYNTYYDKESNSIMLEDGDFNKSDIYLIADKFADFIDGFD